MWADGSARPIGRAWRAVPGGIYAIPAACASYLAINGENLPIIQSVLNHHSLAPTSVYAWLNTKATDRALQGQADRLCGLFVGGEGSGSDQAQLENCELTMLTQGCGIVTFEQREEWAE